MRECGVDKIIFSSSCAVYGVPAVVPTSEDTPCAPINPYGATKMICERMLAECALASPLSFIALRYFNAAGADPEGEIGPCQVPATHAIQLLLEAAAGESPGFTIYGDDYPTADGTGVRDYIHVTDLADAHVKALSALLGGAENMVLNLGTGRGWSVRELTPIDGVYLATGSGRNSDYAGAVADAMDGNSSFIAKAGFVGAVGHRGPPSERAGQLHI